MKTGHVNRNCPTKVKAPKTEVNKGKEKVDAEKIKAYMKKTWKRRDGSSSSNGGVTSPMRSSDHTSSNEAQDEPIGLIHIRKYHTSVLREH